MYLEPHDYWIYYVNIDLRHQYGISAAESQTFLLAKRPQRRRARRNGCFRTLFRCMKGLAPTYLCESLRRRKFIHYHNTRNRESLDIPPSKTKSGQRRFLHRAVNIWNNLDKDFKQLSLPSFKKKVENAHARELF